MKMPMNILVTRNFLMGNILVGPGETMVVRDELGQAMIERGLGTFKPKAGRKKLEDKED
jgi:hypothetical protein